MEQILEQVFFNVPLVKLEPIFKRWVIEAIRETKPESKEPTNPEYLTRKEVKEKLHVSFPTLNRFDKEGILIAQKIGGRVLYLYSDVQKALKQGQNLKYRRV